MRQMMRYRDEAVLRYRNAADPLELRSHDFGSDPIPVCALVLFRYDLAVGGAEMSRDILQPKRYAFAAEVAVVRPVVDVLPVQARLIKAVPHRSPR